jgi:phage tail-like protein
MLQPEALPIAAASGDSLLRSEPAQEREQTDLLVHPGETSEMVLQVKNLCPRAQHLRLEVKGNFPAEWCRWNMEGPILPPDQEMWIGLYFDVPEGYFEEQDNNQAVLTLDYTVTLHLYYRDQQGSRPEQRETLSFKFYVRPHSLYMQFLPGLYREVDLVSRLMSIFEQAFEPSVHALNAMWAYLDPLTAPSALLPFLAHWVGWRMLPFLDDQTQRRLIRHAVELYTWRGTRRALRFYLHLYTGLPLDDHLTQEASKHIAIEEPYGPGFILGDSYLGRDTLLGGGQSFHFIVRLRPRVDQDLDSSLLRMIIDAEKPAFATYELYIEDPSFS